MSINRWIDKEIVVYICNGTLFSHKNERNSVICDDMDKPGGHYDKLNKPDKNTYGMISLIYRI